MSLLGFETNQQVNRKHDLLRKVLLPIRLEKEAVYKEKDCGPESGTLH